MKQTPVWNGWNVPVAAILSAAFLGATLTGCGGGVDSAEYETILDQPETPPSPPVDSTVIVPPETVGASDELGNEEVATTPDAETGSEQPSDTNLASNDVKPGSQADPTGEATSGETPAASPTPTENAVAENEGTTDKPVADAGSSNPEANDPTLATTKAGSKEPVAPKQPRIVMLLIPDKKFKAEGKGAAKALRVSFDDFDLLKVLNMDPVTEDAPSRMPKWLKKLDGKRIRVRGFMMPAYQEEGIRGFTLARDNELCCFGRNPQVYDLVDVFMQKGESTHYIQNRPFDVTGVFHIGDSIIPGQLYSLDDAVVIDR